MSSALHQIIAFSSTKRHRYMFHHRAFGPSLERDVRFRAGQSKNINLHVKQNRLVETQASTKLKVDAIKRSPTRVRRSFPNWANTQFSAMPTSIQPKGTSSLSGQPSLMLDMPGNPARVR